MNPPVPTVEEVLSQTAVGNGFHEFAVEGGIALFAKASLKRALEEAYDPMMPNWPAMVEINDA